MFDLLLGEWLLGEWLLVQSGYWENPIADFISLIAIYHTGLKEK